MTYSIQLSTPYGQFLMNRHDAHQPLAIVRTGTVHIEPELKLLLALARHLPNDALAIDAGANIGLIAIPLAQCLDVKGGSVVAFEPQRLIYYMLAGNTVLAGLENLICHQLALGSESGMLHVPPIDPHQEQDFGMVTLDAVEGEGDTVQTITIDMLDLPRLDFLKIDVEHMELHVLRGGNETITRFKPIIWIEVWPQHYDDIFCWMSEHGYRMYIVDALNFCAVPESAVANFPLALDLFDGRNNPYFPQHGTSQDPISSAKDK